MEKNMNIVVKNVYFQYNHAVVIKDVSLNIQSGEFFFLAGPNGSGKTTLLKLLDGLIKPGRGEIYLDGKDLSFMKRKEIARRVAFVSQDHELPFAFTVEETVLMGRYPYLGILGIEGKRDFEIAEDAMRATGVLKFRDRIVSDLSGGEKQRVVIARALTQRPEMLLLDEPTAHLDLSASVEIMELLKNLQKSRGLTIVIASHDLNLGVRYADRIAFLFQGSKIAEGKPEEVLTEGLLKHVYGEGFRIIYEPSSSIPIIVPGIHNF